MKIEAYKPKKYLREFKFHYYIRPNLKTIGISLYFWNIFIFCGKNQNK